MGKKREKKGYTVGVRKKICPLDLARVPKINFKDLELLNNFISEKGKIVSRRVSGLGAKNQKALTEAIKIARNLSLLSYSEGLSTENQTGNWNSDSR